MSELIQKIKSKFGKMRSVRVSYVKVGIRPTRDWGIILSAALFIFCILAIGAFYFYVLVDQGKLFTVSVDDSQREVKINTVVLTKVISEMDAREANLTKINDDQLKEPDPSI